MSQFTQKKCPTCGGRLELVSGNSYQCCSCHNVYEYNERNANLYHDIELASTFRESLNFKQAELLYKKLLKEYKDDNLADVYWNLLLCEQRVMFETDQNGEQFPSFYDIVPTEIDESEYYGQTISYANKYNPKNIPTYVNLVNKMHLAKKQYKTIKETTKPYDIFICFKKSSIKDPSKLTKDYQLAMDLYNKLNDDYRVFFSERSLNNIVVREYEPNIYHALYTAKIMIIICSQTAYINSQWVKNEWSRFKMMSNTTSQAKSIIPIFRNNFQPEQLPDELRSCQGIREDISLLHNLTQAVQAILKPVDREAEIAAKLKADMETQIKAQQEQMKAQMELFTKQITPSHTSVKPTYIVPQGQKEIQEEQFKNREDLTSVIIPNSVTSIGKNAFQDCSRLTSVYIPSSIKNIGDFAFNGCDNLNEVHITDIAKWCDITFGENTNPLYGANLYLNNVLVDKLDIPNTVTNIKDSTFEGCLGLTSISIPDSVTSIGENAFNDCSGLTSINVASGNPKYHSKGNCLIETESKTLILGCATSVIPTDGSVTNIKEWAFTRCAELTSISIPDSVTSIGDSAFEDCTNLTNVTIGNGVTAISDFAFFYCSELRSITIPNSVTSIGYGAFENCSELTNITIPDSVTNISKNAFNNCAKLTSINIPNSVTSISDNAFNGCSGLTSVTLGNGVTRIGESAFEGCSKLTRITIPDSVTIIDKSAFKNCTSIVNISIGNGVTMIDKDTFFGCSTLTSITLPNNVTRIGNTAFSGCSALTSITLPDTRMAEDAFTGCNMISNAKIPAVALKFIPKSKFETVTIIGGKISNSIRINKKAFQECQSLKTVNISDGITEIGEEAFKNCAKLTCVTIGNDVRRIEKAAFTNCINLKTVNWNAEYFGTMPLDQSYAILSSTSLTTINIGKNVRTIPDFAFVGCSSLTSITIPESVTSIGISAFNGCSGLTSITFLGTKKQWKRIKKNTYWDYLTGKYVIHCTDKDLKKSIFS